MKTNPDTDASSVNEQPRPKERGIESGYITASPQAAGNEPGKIRRKINLKRIYRKWVSPIRFSPLSLFLLQGPVGDPSTWKRPDFTLWRYLENNWGRVVERTLEHVEMVSMAVAIAIVIGVALGIYITKRPVLAKIVLYISGVIMTIPSIAMWGFLLIALSRMGLPGLGLIPAVVGLVLYSQLPIIRNTYTAFKQIDANMLEAAAGMGMSRRQLFFKVEFPLAVPVLMAGIRNAVIINIGIATLAIFIGAGGLGDLINRGIDTSRSDMILAGALAASALALIAEVTFGLIEFLLTPKGIRLQGRR